jgi:serine/threonine protein kinase
MIFMYRSKQAASALAYLEQQNIIHRDISLRNILVADGMAADVKYVIKVDLSH